MEPSSKTVLPKKRPLRRDLKRNYDLYLMVIPAVIAIFIFNYLPMVGVQIAFRNFKPARGIWGSPWVGMKWFERFFNTNYFSDLFFNTLFLSLYSLAATFPIPIILAIILNQYRSQGFKRILQTVSYAPHFISTVVMVGMITIFLSPSTGLYGHLTRAMGGTPQNLLGSADAFRSIYVWSDVWQHSGWDSIIYLAALTSIDPPLYEAATIDGATRMQKIRHLELPLLLPTICILLIMRVGNLMTVGFEKVYLLQNNLNVRTSEVFATYVYKVGLTQSPQYSYSAAVGLFSTLINLVLLTSCNAVVRKLSDNSLW